MSPDTVNITDETVLDASLVSIPRALDALRKAGFNTAGDVRRDMKRACKLKYVGQSTMAELSTIATAAAQSAAVAATSSDPEDDEAGHDATPIDELPQEPRRRRRPTETARPKQVEEGTHPLILQSPHHQLRVSWVSRNQGQRLGRRHAPRESREAAHVGVKDGGLARLGRELYLMRKYDRDRARVAQAIANNEPWRVEAAGVVRSLTNHGRDFFLVEE